MEIKTIDIYVLLEDDKGHLALSKPALEALALNDPGFQYDVVGRSVVDKTLYLYINCHGYFESLLDTDTVYCTPIDEDDDIFDTTELDGPKPYAHS